MISDPQWRPLMWPVMRASSDDRSSRSGPVGITTIAGKMIAPTISTQAINA
jgi:hypothetical protein